MGFPNHPLTDLANVVAKLCAFAVTWTMVLPALGCSTLAKGPAGAVVTP